MFSAIGSAVLAAVGFGLLVLVHEMGHFLAAKIQGMRVEAFSLGFGPCVKRKWGDTEYRLSLIPLGGYVKLAGEEPDSERKPQPGDFHGRPAGQRALVFVAGVFMNIVFGFIFFILAYQLGVPVIPPRVGGVVNGSPAWKAGLKRGDVIARINDMKGPIDFTDLTVTVMLAGKGDKVRLGIDRAGSRLEVEVKPEYSERAGNMWIGLQGPSNLELDEFEEPRSGAAADDVENFGAVYAAGLRAGDVITGLRIEGRAKGEALSTPLDFIDAVRASGGRQVTIEYSRGGVAQKPVAIQPTKLRKNGWFVGIGFAESNTIEAVRKDTWARGAGFREGDVILSVDGKRVRSGTEAFDALDAVAGKAAAVRVQREGGEIALNLTARTGEETARDVLGFAEGEPMLVASTFPEYPARKAGLEPGDMVTELDGESVTEIEEFHRILQQSGGRPLELSWVRDGEKMRATITPGSVWMIPVPWKQEKGVIKTGIGRSFTLGTRKSFQWIVRIYSTLRGLVRGTISARHLNGPLLIAKTTYRAAESSMGMLVYFLAIISVNLGIVNLLPIPILDGGHLLFVAVEKARGKPLSEKLRGALSYVGLAMILGLVVLTFWNDIRILFFG